MDLKTVLPTLSLGGIAGYFGSLISGPIKLHLTDWRERRLLRRNLYSEMAHNYLGLRSFLEPTHLDLLEPRFVENIRGHSSLQVYERAKSQPHLFLELDEWSQITHIDEFLLRIVNSQLPSRVTANQGKALLTIIEESILSNFLSLKLFSHVKPDISGLIKQIQRGSRKRSLESYGDDKKRLSDDIERCLQERRARPLDVPNDANGELQ